MKTQETNISVKSCLKKFLITKKTNKKRNEKFSKTLHEKKIKLKNYLQTEKKCLKMYVCIY